MADETRATITSEERPERPATTERSEPRGERRGNALRRVRLALGDRYAAIERFLRRHNVGVALGDGWCESIDMSEWQRIMHVNAGGALMMAKANRRGSAFVPRTPRSFIRWMAGSSKSTHCQ